MKNIKRFAVMAAVIVSLTMVSVSVFAKSDTSVAETVAKITNTTVEKVEAQKAEGMAYGQIAVAADKLEEFKLARSTARKENLAAKVAQGKITQTQADEFEAKMQLRQADCDGSGVNQNSENNGLKLHTQNGLGEKNGQGKSQGANNGERLQKKLADGTNK